VLVDEDDDDDTNQSGWEDAIAVMAAAIFFALFPSLDTG